jgi:hypothetical protein
MPSVTEQLALPDSRTSPDRLAARFLLRPGRAYEEAVTRFSPYDRIRDLYPEGRTAGAELLRESLREDRRGAFIYVNNRFEGNALQTIVAMLAGAGLFKTPLIAQPA